MKGRAALAGRRLASARRFWEAALHGAEPAVIPADFAQAEVSPIAGTVRFRLAPPTVAAMTAAANDREALIFTLLVSGLTIVLRHYTGSDEVIVATGVHKDYAEARLNQLLLLRDAVDGDVPVRTLVARLQKTIAAAFDHQKFPVARLLEEHAVVYGGKPLFQIAILYDGVHDLRGLDDVAAEIVILLRRRGVELAGEIRFREDRFRPQTLELMARHLDRAIAQVLAKPEAAVEVLRLDDPAPAAVTSPPAGAAVGEPVHEWFRRIALESPGAMAVLGADPCRYDTLNRRSNQLARWLIGVGVEPGAPIAICYDHGADALVAILAVLKAGACYVPLDPLQPSKRTALILDDAQPVLVLAQERTMSALPDHTARVIDPEAVASVIAREDDGDFASECDPADIAYVIYTSGSTGRPKGVAIHHEALTNYVAWAADNYVRGESGLTFALFSSMAFDLTVTSIFVPLVTGNAIVPYSRTLVESAVPQIVDEGRVDILKVTPSHLSLLRQGRYPVSRLRRLIVGGEPLEAALAARIREAFGGRIEIINEYGPAETTVGCVAHTFDAARDRRAFVPIGRAAANTRADVVDELGRAVDVNAVGELCIAGLGVGQGYLRNPRETASRFVPDPLADGARMYRTGDLARVLADGALEFVGRRDGQVKVQGHRVELEELRLALNQHPQVRDSVVVARRDAKGVDRLVAYYVARRAIDAADLRVTMIESLPREIVPQVYVHVRRLPIAPSGKIDWRALPALDEPAAGSTGEAIAGEPPVEGASSAGADARMAYWRAQLDGAPALNLPADADPEAADAGAVACEAAVVAAATLERWEDLCDREGITLQVLLVAAWAVILARWSQQDDLIIGTNAVRSSGGIDSVMAGGGQTLPLRLRIDPRAHVRGWLRHVHEIAREADANRDVLVRALDTIAVRGEAGRPLVHAVVTVREAVAAVAAGAPVGLDAIAGSIDRPLPFEVALDAIVSPEALEVRLAYRRARFTADRVRQWLLELQALVTAIAGSAERPVGALPWLDDLQAARVRQTSAGPTHGAARAIVAQIAERADRRPDAVAVAAGGAAVTYRALERRATAFARTLRAHGVGPEVRVGVCMDRSPDLVASLLAVWKAGGAFVLLDPASPRDRLAATIARAGLRTVVAQARTEPSLPPGAAAILRLEASDILDGLSFTATMPPYVFGETLACVIETAHASGTPVAVEIAHGGLSNLVVGQMAAFELRPGDRVLQQASIGSGPSVAEIFTTLASGATLDLPCEAAGDLPRLLAARAITTVALPPPMWQGLVPDDLPALRTAIVAGGGCPSAIAPAWRGRRLMTTYGPPEATICAATGLTSEKTGDAAIGRPIGNTQIYVLDAECALVAHGVVGEIYIGGAGVARGYLCRPSLTAEAFVPDPHGDVPGARLFRTGDLGRYDANGDLHYLGRREPCTQTPSAGGSTCP